MKNLYLYLSLFLYSLTALSQNENNHWILGPTHVDFSSNVITTNTVVGPGMYPPSEYRINAPAAISDSNGNLLFYFDGIDIRDRNNNFMLNGQNLGIESLMAYQGAIIIPHPGDSKKYYVIWDMYHFVIGGGTTGAYGSIYYYAIVDFTNNNLGEVLWINDDWQSEPYNFESTYRKRLRDQNGLKIVNGYENRPLTFSKKATNNGYWVLLQSGNKIFTYNIDAAGLNPLPTMSSFSGLNSSDMFRIVPDYSNLNNTKLYGMNSISFYSLDFNKSTGQLSGYQNISIERNGMDIKCFEMSPDFKKVYFIMTTPSPSMYPDLIGHVIVKDLSSLVTPARRLYEFTNSTLESKFFSFIQKDKYDNVLVGSDNDQSNRNKYIHKIENPNSFLNSSIRVNYLYMNGEKNYSFPQLFSRVPISCIENIILSTTETAVNRTYKVSNTITTNNNYIVNSGSVITLQAQNAIYLEPNTDIKSGSVFVAEIKNCSPILQKSASFIEDSVNSYENESVSNTSLVLYPNPANQSVTISADNSINNLTVTSMEGFIMYKKDVMSTSVDIDVSDYKKGIYIVTIQTSEGKILTEKLIKN